MPPKDKKTSDMDSESELVRLIKSNQLENAALFGKINDKLDNLTDKFDNFESRLDTIEAKQEDLISTIDKVENDVGLATHEIDSLSEKFNGLLQHRREYNVIFYNLDKAPGISTTNVLHAEDLIENLLINICKVKLHPGFIDHTVRLGHLGVDNVPFLCKCVRKRDRDFLLENSSKIFSNIEISKRPHISEDLSNSDREVNKCLVEVAKEMRKDNLIAIIPNRLPRVIKYKKKGDKGAYKKFNFGEDYTTTKGVVIKSKPT